MKYFFNFHEALGARNVMVYPRFLTYVEISSNTLKVPRVSYLSSKVTLYAK